MKTFFYFILWVLTGFLFNTCNKNPAIIPAVTCMDFEYASNQCWVGAGPLYGDRGVQFKAPHFNPNNPYEFAFIEENHDSISSNSKLSTYDMLTFEKQYLTDDLSDETHPKWNLNNKILFNKHTQIYLINSDGDSLKQLTFSGIDADPEWIDSNNICYENNTIGIFLNLLDYSNQIIESKPLTKSDVSLNRIIAATNDGADDPNIAISSVDSIDWTVITNNTFNSGRDRITCIQWHPNNKDIYYTKWNNGLYKTNINTKKEKRILEGCQSKWYNHFSISPDGKKIIAERIDATFEAGVICYINETSSIVLMDIDGSNEVTVLPKPE